MNRGSGSSETRIQRAKAELASPDWLLAGFDEDREMFQFAAVSRQTYFESSFLDHRIKPMPDRLVSATGNEVDAVLKELESRPAAYIFHSAFCASTLLATCLDDPVSTLVLREPMVLTHLARRVRQPEPDNSGKLHRLKSRVKGLLDRSYRSERVLIKPSNFANSLIPDLVSEVTSGGGQRKCVMLSNGMQNLLISILKKPDEARSLMPVFLASLLKDSDYLQHIELPPIETLDLLQQSVVFWHCQRHYFQSILHSAGESHILPVGMESILHEPYETLSAINAFLELDLSPEQITKSVTSGALQRHSKVGTNYGPEQQKAEAQAMAKRYSAELEQALQWAKPLLRTLPIKPFSGFEEPAV